MYVVIPTISCSLMCSSFDVSLTFCVAHVVSGNTYIEDIYFFLKVNSKYISSNVLKISGISRVHSTSEIADIFNIRDEIFLVFTEKKVNFLFFPLRGKNLTFCIVISR